MVSVTEYSRRKGVSQSAITQAIQRGRITREADGRINVEAADRDWEANRIGWGTAAAQKSGKVVKRRKPAVTERAEGDGPIPGPSMSQSRAVFEHYKARLAKLEFEKQTGKLIDAQGVEKAAFSIARSMRDALLAVPDRTAAMFAAQTDAAAIHRTLTTELTNICNDMAAALVQGGGATDEGRYPSETFARVWPHR